MFWGKSRTQEKQGKEEKNSDSSSIIVAKTGREFTITGCSSINDISCLRVSPKDQWNKGSSSAEQKPQLKLFIKTTTYTIMNQLYMHS